MMVLISPFALSLLCLSVMFGALSCANANEGRHGQDHSHLHEIFYQKLVRPDTGNPCCNNGDCRSTSGRRLEDHYEVKVDGNWVVVPDYKIVPESAPDGGYHVCAPRFYEQPHQLFCVIVPPET
jgi:hypothetical protein